MLKPALFASLLLVSGFAAANDPVTDAMQAAYAPYRVVLFKTNSNAQDDARKAIAQAQQKWNQIATQFGAQPPAPYDRDSSFKASLDKVSEVYAKAAGQIDKNELTDAHETLEQAREVIAEIRHRNQIIVYSDHMNAYHAQMEKVLIDGPKTLLEPNGLLQLTAQVGALDYLSAKLSSEAPVDYLKNDEFVASYNAVEQSVADLKTALFTQDVAQVKAALGKVKVPYSKMFIKFG